MLNWNQKMQQGLPMSAAEMKRELAVRMQAEKYGAALGVVAAMIQQGIQDADAFYDAAYSYFMTRDYERAIEWLDNTLRLAPTHVKARILLALALLKTNDHDEIRRMFREY